MSLPNMKRPCRDCPYRKDSMKGWLGENRMKELLEQQSFVCHKKQHLQCAGHMLMLGNENEFVRLANALGIPLQLTGRELIFDSKSDCVTHHRNEIDDEIEVKNG